MTTRICLAILIVIIGPWIGSTAFGQQLAADISAHQVDITTGFNGTTVTVFGAIEGGGDVIIVARGPAKEIVVRHKTRESAIWLNTSSFTFRSVPAYYAVLSTVPVNRLIPAATRQLDGIGVDLLNLAPTEKATQDDLGAFRTALLENLHKAGLYREESGAINFLSPHLFRATLTFPASVPTGNYPISVFLVQDNEIVAAKTLPLVIAESGFEATTHEFSILSPTLYGFVAVAVAAMAGWLGTLLFRTP